jgi:predicted HTH domain antitoxin
VAKQWQKVWQLAGFVIPARRRTASRTGDETRFSREMYEAAIVKWYDEGRISSGKSAEFLGISRAAFLDLLFRHKVAPFQYTPEELA